MRLRKGIWILAAALPTLSAPTDACAAPVQVSLVGHFGAAQRSQTTSSTSATSDGRLGIGGGLLIGLPFTQTSRWKFEVGGLYAPREIGFGDSNLQSLPFVQIPFLVRVGSQSLSLGAGPYASIGLGQVSTTLSGATTQGGLSDAGLSSFDYGALFSAQLAIPIKKLPFRVLADVRYALGIRNLATSTGVTTRFNEAHVLAGIQFGGGK